MQRKPCEASSHGAGHRLDRLRPAYASRVSTTLCWPTPPSPGPARAPAGPGPRRSGEEVVVAGAGMVAGDDAQLVNGQRAEVVDATTDALSGAAAGAGGAAHRLVLPDERVFDRAAGRGLHRETPAQPVAAVAAVASGPP